MDLKEKVKSLPSTPGVYRMRDSLGGIIYVGKSKNLKSRVSSYFVNSKSHSPKVVKLVKNLKDFDFILTDTEFEAFMLECRLIKEIKPAYNRKMKSPLSYTYIRIDTNEPYASIEATNEKEELNGVLYFGPYTSKSTVERAVQGIKESCKILCSNSSRSGKACFYYSLGLCMGMCTGSSVQEQYGQVIDKIIGLLNGNDKCILSDMERRMQEASEKFDFETAVKYRDYIGAVNALLSSQKVIGFIEENKNIAMVEYLNGSSFKFFLIKGNKVIFSEKYDLSSLELNEIITIMADKVFHYFNSNSLSTSLNICKDEIDEAHIIYSYLKNNNCRYVVFPEQWLEYEDTDNVENVLKDLLKQDNI